MMILAGRVAVLLDAGGTLITLDYQRVRECLGTDEELLGDEALDLAEARARSWAGEAMARRLAWRELWNGYFSRALSLAGYPSDLIPEALDLLWEANRRQGLWRRPVPEAAEVLERLHAAGRRLAVVSNAEGQVEADLERCGFGRWLETVVDSHLVGVAKPDPRIFEIALERLGIGPQDAVYVGDVPAFDVEGAQAAGIQPILLDPHGIYSRLEVPRIRSLLGLPPLLGV